MVYLFQVLFFLGFIIALFGVWIERIIVMGAISEENLRATPLAYTHKKRLENLAFYKKILIRRGDSLHWYWIMYCIYEYSDKYMYLMILIGILSIVF